jgi:hypothetical protein
MEVKLACKGAVLLCNSRKLTVVQRRHPVSMRECDGGDCQVVRPDRLPLHTQLAPDSRMNSRLGYAKREDRKMPLDAADEALASGPLLISSRAMPSMPKLREHDCRDKLPLIEQSLLPICHRAATSSPRFRFRLDARHLIISERRAPMRNRKTAPAPITGVNGGHGLSRGDSFQPLREMSKQSLLLLYRQRIRRSFYLSEAHGAKRNARQGRSQDSHFVILARVAAKSILSA